jgi:hypothetical protein
MSDLLKEMLLEPADAEFQKVEGRVLTNMEVLAAGIMVDALRGGRDARDAILNRVEGKPGQAAQTQAPDTALEEQLDKLGIEALNDLAPDAAE